MKYVGCDVMCKYVISRAGEGASGCMRVRCWRIEYEWRRRRRMTEQYIESIYMYIYNR